MVGGRLSGKTAWITGGGSGIGRAITRRFLQEGCRVAICGRNPGRLRSVWDEAGRSEALHYHACDVADPAQVNATADWAIRVMGGIDILVNNAGVNVKERAVRELTVEAWQQLLRINLDGAFFCIAAVLPHMRRRGGGLIINISSVAGKRALPLSGAAYTASKFGMSALSLCVGAEEKDHYIRCTAIYPGEVDTPILDLRPTPATPEHRSTILQPEDVAEAAVFVATLHPRANVPELVIKPTSQLYL